jgi:hypothetical protein
MLVDAYPVRKFRTHMPRCTIGRITKYGLASQNIFWEAKNNSRKVINMYFITCILYVIITLRPGLDGELFMRRI